MGFQVNTGFSRVLTTLREHGGAPDLKLLGQCVVDAMVEQPGVQVVTFAVNPAVSVMIDPNWKSRSMQVLSGGESLGRAQWESYSTPWPEHLPEDDFDWGTQPPPNETPWPQNKTNPTSAHAAGDWARLLVTAGSRGAILVSVGYTDSLNSDPTRGQEVAQMQQVLQLIVDQWVGFASRDLELNQLSSQKKALSRLNRLQGRFVGMASHEFKTPLTSITAYADALLGQFDEEHMPLATEFLGVIRNEAGRLLRMVNRILDFSRMEYGARLLGATAHDLVPLVNETILTLRPAITTKKLTCVMEDVDNIPRAMVDADLIRQVMVNLVGNAVKFTPKTGRIGVSLHETESSVEVRISDTGPGIPQRDMHRIFREFYRSRETASREEGTGLGLTIVRHIINLHGGSVEAHQRLGGGSVFTFRVPKEVHVLGPLPDRYIQRVNEDDTMRLLTISLQLMAEMVEAKKLVFMLSNNDGELNPAVGFGWLESSKILWTKEQLGSWKEIHGVQLMEEKPDLDWSWYPEGKPKPEDTILVSLNHNNQLMGCLVVQRSNQDNGFARYFGEQLLVLSRVIAAALYQLVDDEKRTQEMSGLAQVTKTIEALRTLLQIRRNGVPTASPEALHLTRALAREMSLDPSEVQDLQYAAALHDAGMARVEDEILLGESELSFDERDEVDRHVDQGVDLMSPLLNSDGVIETIRHHHERFDGSGFPDGKQGSDIPQGARLLAVIDTWFSLTQGRSYRVGLSADEALQEILGNVGTQFDPRVVTAFEIVLQREGCLQNIPLQHGPLGFGI